MMQEGNELVQMRPFPTRADQVTENNQELTLEDFANTDDQEEEYDDIQQLQKTKIDLHNAREKIRDIEQKLKSVDQIAGNELKRLKRVREKRKDMEEEPHIKQQLIRKMFVDFDYYQAVIEELESTKNLVFWNGIGYKNAEIGFKNISVLLDLNQANLNRDAVLKELNKALENSEKLMQKFVDSAETLMEKRDAQIEKLVEAVEKLALAVSKQVSKSSSSGMDGGISIKRSKSGSSSSSSSDDDVDDVSDEYADITEDDVMTMIGNHVDGIPSHILKKKMKGNPKEIDEYINNLVEQGKVEKKGARLIPLTDDEE